MRGYSTNPVLTNPTIKQIAGAHNVSEAQVVLRWALQEGQVVIPRSSKQPRIARNRELWGFNLDPQEVEAIARLAGQPPSRVDKL